MKNKMISMMLILTLLAGFLVGCGGNKKADAQPLIWTELQDEIQINPARAESNYRGKYFSFEGTVVTLATDYCIIIDDSAMEMEVKFNKKNELASLNFGDKITIVGKLKYIQVKRLVDSSIVQIIPMEENTGFLVDHFISDKSYAKALLNQVENFDRTSGEKIEKILSAGYPMDFKEQYYRVENGEYNFWATYEGKLETWQDGSGMFTTKGKEVIKWCVDGNNLYFKISDKDDNQLKTDQYKYDVYTVKDLAGQNDLLCVGPERAFIISL